MRAHFDHHPRTIPGDPGHVHSREIFRATAGAQLAQLGYLAGEGPRPHDPPAI